jgi:hypothetical protein
VRPLLQQIVYFRLAAETPPALGYRLPRPLTAAAVAVRVHRARRFERGVSAIFSGEALQSDGGQ